MPRILEFREIDNDLWCKIERPVYDAGESGYVYIWTKEEAEAAKASTIRSFCFALANAYIEGRLDAQPSPAPID